MVGFEENLFCIKFNYTDSESKERLKAIEKAFEDREIRWVRKIYNPKIGQAEYIGKLIGRGIITDSWLQAKYKEYKSRNQKDNVVMY